MRQFTAVAVLVLTLIAGAFGMARAQTPEPESSDTAATTEEIPGASLEILGEATSETRTVGMTLYRITLEPGVEIPAHWHSGSVTWYVDSGTLSFTVVEGEVWVRCAADCVPGATPDQSGFMLVPEGTEVVLEAGDWIIQHDTTEHAYRNAGDTDAVIDASTTYSLEEVEATPAAGGATPAAGPPIRPRGCGGGCF